MAATDKKDGFSKRADAVVSIDKSTSGAGHPVTITREEVRNYPLTGEAILNEWDRLKTATNMTRLPFYANHKDHTIWGEVVDCVPCDETKSWKGRLVLNESAPPEFVQLVESGKPLPVSWEYLLKTEPADGEHEGKHYNRKGVDYIGTGLAYAPEGEWGARCDKCKINPTEDADPITITKPLADAALIDLLQMGDPNGAEKMTEATKETPQAETGAASGAAENSTVETKVATDTSGATSTETKAEEVTTKAEVKTTKKKAGAKADVQHQKEEEGKEEVIDTKTDDGLLARIAAMMDEKISKALAAAKPVADASDVDAIKSDLKALKDAEAARKAAQLKATEDAERNTFRAKLNEAGKAKMDSDPEFYKSFRDAEASRTSLDWVDDHKHLFDAKVAPGQPLGVDRMFFPSGDDTKKLSFSGKSAREIAHEIFPGADPEKDFTRR